MYNKILSTLTPFIKNDKSEVAVLIQNIVKLFPIYSEIVDYKIVWQFFLNFEEEKFISSRELFLKRALEKKVLLSSSEVKPFLTLLMTQKKIPELETILNEPNLNLILSPDELGFFWGFYIKEKLKTLNSDKQTPLMESVEFLNKNFHKVPIKLEKLEAEILSIAFSNCLQYLQKTGDWETFNQAYSLIYNVIALNFYRGSSGTFQLSNQDEDKDSTITNESMFGIYKLTLDSKVQNKESSLKRLCKVNLLFIHEAMKMSLSDELKSEVEKAALFILVKSIKDGIHNKEFYNEVLNQYVYYVKPNDSIEYFHHLNQCRSLVQYWFKLGGIKEDSFEFLKYAFTLHFSDKWVDISEKHPHLLIQKVQNIDPEFLHKYFKEFIDKENPITLWKSIFALNSYRHIMDDTTFDTCSKIVFESVFANPFFTICTKPSKELIKENTPFELLNNYEGQDFLEVFHWFLDLNKTKELCHLAVEQCEKILKNLIKTGTYASLFKAYIIFKKYEVYFHISETRTKKKFYDILKEILTHSLNYKDPYDCKEFPRVREAMQACKDIKEIPKRYKLNMYETYLITCKNLTLSEEIVFQIEKLYQIEKNYAINSPMFMAFYIDIMKLKEKKK